MKTSIEEYFNVNWSGKSVLVTGAGGFIGSHLVERLLLNGASVKALAHYRAVSPGGWLNELPPNDRLEIAYGDIADYEFMRQTVAGCDIVFHLAALIAIPYSYQAPRSFFRTNLEGTLNVLQAARESGVARVVHTSTSEVYGSAQYVPIDELHPIQAQSPYSASKIAADAAAYSYFCSYNLPVVTARPFNTFGPRQSARAVIPTVISQALTRDVITLGNTSSTRDFNYVENTVEGFLSLAEADQAIGQTFNFGTGREVSIQEVVEIVFSITGRKLDVNIEQTRLRPERSEVDRLCASYSKASGVCGWKPRISLEEGLRRTVEWVQGNLDHFRPEKYTL